MHISTFKTALNTPIKKKLVGSFISAAQFIQPVKLNKNTQKLISYDAQKYVRF